MIQHEVGYALDALPFPTLLSDEQRQRCSDRIREWQAQLEALA